MSELNKIIIISSPSGGGKSTIVKALLTRLSSLALSVSATTRSARNTELHGREYYFLSQEYFQKRLSQNQFLEWEEVYPGLFYGTLHSEIVRINELGKYPVFEVDVRGGLKLKKHFGDAALAVFIQPPNIDALRERLTARSQNTSNDIAVRLAKAESEIKQGNEYDIIILNDNLENAILATQKAVENFLTPMP